MQSFVGIRRYHANDEWPPTHLVTGWTLTGQDLEAPRGRWTAWPEFLQFGVNIKRLNVRTIRMHITQPRVPIIRVYITFVLLAHCDLFQTVSGLILTDKFHINTTIKYTLKKLPHYKLLFSSSCRGCSAGPLQAKPKMLTSFVCFVFTALKHFLKFKVENEK